MVSNRDATTDIHTLLISAVMSVLCAVVCMSVFISWFTVGAPALGTCEAFGQERAGRPFYLEGTGPYQHKHCYDPQTGQMYLPKGIDP